MQKLLAAAALCALVIFGPEFGPAGVGAQDLPPAKPAVNLTVEQRHVIKEIVLKDYNLNKAPAGIKLSIGEQKPPSVPALPIPVEVSDKVPQIRSHAFFIVGEQVVLVDSANRIVDVIE
jgi:hypothetical protein